MLEVFKGYEGEISIYLATRRRNYLDIITAYDHNLLYL